MNPGAYRWSHMKTLLPAPRQVLALALVLGLIASPTGPTVAGAAADSARLPRTDFPACSASQTTYCISEVVLTDGGTARTAKWVPNGSPTLDAAGAANNKTFNTFGSAATNYTGRWSYDGFPVASREFDGLYVKVAPANEFTDTMQISVEPAGPSAAGVVGRVKDPATNRVASLPIDLKVKVTVRLGQLNPALTMAVGTDVSVTRALDGSVQVMTFEGSPVAVAQQASSADCDSTTSVAVAKPNQFFALVAFKNGRDPYGVDGISGDMVITSNGVCKLTTPTWNRDTKSMDFTAAAPHFAPDGTTVNTGFYRAVIPAADADLLFGLTSLDATTQTSTTTVTATTTTTSTTLASPTTVRSAGVSTAAFISAGRALTVEVRDSGGSQVTASRNVSFDGTRFVVSATGFTYSTKTLRMQMGTPPNAPRKIASYSSTLKRGVLSVIIPATDTKVVYQASLRSATSRKTVSLKCTRKGKTVICVSARLQRGNWNLSVTPTRDGMVAPSSKKVVRVP